MMQVTCVVCGKLWYVALLVTLYFLWTVMILVTLCWLWKVMVHCSSGHTVLSDSHGTLLLWSHCIVRGHNVLSADSHGTLVLCLWTVIVRFSSLLLYCLWTVMKCCSSLLL